MLTMCKLDRFTGPKITLSADDLTEEQQEALKEEGLEVQIDAPATGTQNAPISSADKKADAA